MSDFPIDLFLLNKNTNYYKNKLFGKSRMILEILFIQF